MVQLYYIEDCQIFSDYENSLSVHRSISRKKEQQQNILLTVNLAYLIR